MLQSFLRGVMFMAGCLIVLGTSFGIANAASGGLFGDILAKMLGITPSQVLTYSGDGTVSNAQRLGGVDASNYQRVMPSQSCGTNQCIYGFDPSGNILCR